MNKQKREQNNDANRENSTVAFLFVFAVVLIGSSSILAPAFHASESDKQAGELSYLEGTVLGHNRQTGRYLKVPSRFLLLPF